MNVKPPATFLPIYSTDRYECKGSLKKITLANGKNFGLKDLREITSEIPNWRLPIPDRKLD